ncbi:MAG: NAD(P)H-dependent oxidoreductase [Clostridia bacterium]|nr:NAD(P)H-dependent oxidoreductase [Clostridia bacterium]
MRILVINGSPKGKDSVTLQTVEYLKIKNPGIDFEIIHAGRNIRAYEKDFGPAIEAIDRADAVLFSYPVYTFIAPSQLHRFIELMKEHHAPTEGKFATQITTSKHFYDITAHRYVMENCQDMGMKFVRGLSADMDDLTKEKGRREADSFFSYFMWCMENGHCEPVRPSIPEPARIPAAPAEETPDKTGDVVIIADYADDDIQLAGMINRFRSVFSRNTRVINIREYPFRGGCLGCFQCASTGKCIYKDGFDDFLRNTIQTAEGVVYAFAIRDHSMGARFKTYDDRQFCNGHRTVTMGTPVGYLISGSYSHEENLRMILEGRAEVGGNFFCGVASDETDTDAAIDRLAATMAYALENGHTQPSNFLGVGDMKIFRDLIYLMQGMMKADHRFFKAHGQYDFPQKKKGTLLAMYLVGWMMSSKTLQKKAGGKMTEGMLMPYKKVLDKVRKEMEK